MDPALEISLRIASATTIFAALTAWEILAPRRHLLVGRKVRWPNNIGILVIDAVAVRLIIPTAAVGVALLAAERGWGLFNALGLPGWLAGLLGFLLLDLIIYGQHFAFHHVPVLWRLHRMHHADLDIDVTTGVRFHPIEILLSMLIKIAAVLAFGIPAVAVVLFEVVLNATSMFNHSNVAMPAALDAWCAGSWSRPICTACTTRSSGTSRLAISASICRGGTGFGTYRRQPEAGHDGMTVGIPSLPRSGRTAPRPLLTQPFRNDRTSEQGEAGATAAGLEHRGP